MLPPPAFFFSSDSVGRVLTRVMLDFFYIVIAIQGYDVAKEENMSVEDPVLQLLLTRLPHDNNWNLAIPREAAMAEAGELRYNYNKAKLSNYVVEVSQNTKVEKWGDVSKAKNTLALADEAAEESNPVKAEPGFKAFSEAAEAFEKHRKALQLKEQPCKDVLAGLEYKVNNENQSLKDKADECRVFLDALSEKLGKARELSVAVGAKLGQKAVDMDLQKKCKEFGDQLETDLFAVQSLLKKYKALL